MAARVGGKSAEHRYSTAPIQSKRATTAYFSLGNAGRPARKSGCKETRSQHHPGLFGPSSRGQIAEGGSGSIEKGDRMSKSESRNRNLSAIRVSEFGF